jgi:hypothetical protein
MAHGTRLGTPDAAGAVKRSAQGARSPTYGQRVSDHSGGSGGRSYELQASEIATANRPALPLDCHRRKTQFVSMFV